MVAYLQRLQNDKLDVVQSSNNVFCILQFLPLEVHESLGQSDSEPGDELEETVPAESIESDIELKLHIMGSKRLWTRS